MQAEPTPEAEKVIVRFFKHLIRRRTLDSLRRTEGAQVSYGRGEAEVRVLEGGAPPR
jgi:hypothetical protein